MSRFGRQGTGRRSRIFRISIRSSGSAEIGAQAAVAPWFRVRSPRSPGREPGDTGAENHPAIHAARRQVLCRFKPAQHGNWEGVQPGVPGLPPGDFCVGGVRVPRSPGREPGDSGSDSQPAIHAARRQVICRFNLAQHGNWEGVQPGVPRLPPGAFCGRRCAWPQGSCGRHARPEFSWGGPRSPGREPGDTGSESHPAIHAARRQVISWLETVADGERGGR